MNEPNRFLALLFMGLLMFAVCLMAANARAQCPGGVCPLPKVVKGEMSVVASRTTTACRTTREVICKPKCQSRCVRDRCHCKRNPQGAVRRVLRRFGR